MRDMTPEELKRFEEEVVQSPRESEKPARGDAADVARDEVTPDDDDGMPESPVKYRVPS